jgi:ATP-binding cassette subfamily G (WHITE) protein 2 (SNQ2)
MTSYPTGLGPNQVCTLAGSTAGSTVVSGSAYIAASFEYAKSGTMSAATPFLIYALTLSFTPDIWRNFGILLLFFFAFVILQGVAAETLSHGAFAPESTFSSPPSLSI